MANYAARFQKKDIGIYGAAYRIRTYDPRITNNAQSKQNQCIYHIVV